MFTGIIEALGKVTAICEDQHNLLFEIESPISAELKIDQSVSHNGICLTVTFINENRHTVCAIPETTAKTNIKHWKKGDTINLERCLTMNGRLDGHIVQGHVDCTAICSARIEDETGVRFTFKFDTKYAPLVIEKGSICINGISLTCFDITANTATVAIIPYTLEHTNLQQIQVADEVNIEFDIIGKYLARKMQLGM